jgi:endonuclease-3
MKKIGNHKRARIIVELLEKAYPDAKIILHHSNPLELLIATILSAQCTDERVNKVTEQLFNKYRRAEDYANSAIETLEESIRSTGFYHSKAKNIKAACKLLVEKFNSRVPRKMEEILTLPGVARKTANVVLSNAYGIVEGVVVDTHVGRVANRLGLTMHQDPTKIEKDLMEIIPKKYWKRIADLLIFHGRNACTARNPRCALCMLKKVCPSAFTFNG